MMQHVPFMGALRDVESYEECGVLTARFGSHIGNWLGSLLTQFRTDSPLTLGSLGQMARNLWVKFLVVSSRTHYLTLFNNP